MKQVVSRSQPKRRNECLPCECRGCEAIETQSERVNFDCCVHARAEDKLSPNSFRAGHVVATEAACQRQTPALPE
jgi:hypothetical protein